LVTFVEFENQLRLEYLVLPLIVVAAIRFRLRGGAPAALIASGVAVWAAVKGTGPFATETLLQKMITLQVFNVFVTLSSFVLSSYVETRDAAQRARVANETKSEFLRVAAHELRSPLSVLTGYLSLLSAGDLGKPPEKWKRPLEILTAKTAELNNVMDQLLEVARLDGDVLAPARQVIDLRTVVEDAVERARPRAALVGGEVDVDLGSEAVHVMGDATQLGHVVDNLINNALAYSEGAPRVSVMAMGEASRAVVRVADRGIGVDDDMRDAIFEPFRRGEHDHAPGSGLGLYISRELARAHGGTLALERSAPGVGSTFVLALPRRVTEASIRA
jgi:signal transduction histidine kinase